MTARKTKAGASPGPPGDNGFSLISEAKLFELYVALLKCRLLEEHIRSLSRPGKLPARCRRSLGRAAPAVGAVIDLRPEDTLSVCDGGLSVSLAQGVPPRHLYAALYPDAANARGAAGVVQLKAAVRAAAAAKEERNGRIAVVFCGAEGKTGAVQTAWREAMRRADAENLPIVFVDCCDAGTRYRGGRGKHYDFPGIVVDGNDVVAIYRVASEAIAHARRGNGPTLVECEFVRLSGTRKRGGEPADDPVRNLENYLSRKGLFRQHLKAEVTTKFQRQLRTIQGFSALRAGAHG